MITAHIQTETVQTKHRVENSSSIAYNKKTAGYLVTAARHYLEAAKHEAAGDHKKAYESTIQAEGILLLALTFRDKK